MSGRTKRRGKPTARYAPATFTLAQMRVIRDMAHAAARHEINMLILKLRPAPRRGGCG
jgi:hypothetical protein